MGIAEASWSGGPLSASTVESAVSPEHPQAEAGFGWSGINAIAMPGQANLSFLHPPRVAAPPFPMMSIIGPTSAEAGGGGQRVGDSPFASSSSGPNQGGVVRENPRGHPRGAGVGPSLPGRTARSHRAGALRPDTVIAADSNLKKEFRSPLSWPSRGGGPTKTPADLPTGDRVVDVGRGECEDEAPLYRRQSPGKRRLSSPSGWSSAAGPAPPWAEGPPSANEADDALKRRAAAIVVMVKGLHGGRLE